MNKEFFLTTIASGIVFIMGIWLGIFILYYGRIWIDYLGSGFEHLVLKFKCRRCRNYLKPGMVLGNNKKWICAITGYKPEKQHCNFSENFCPKKG